MNIRESRASRGNSISLTPEMNNDLLGGETEDTNSAEVTSGGRYNAQEGDGEENSSGSFSGRRLRHVILAIVGVCGLSFGVALGYAAFSASDSDNGPAYNSETEQGGFIETILLRNAVPLACSQAEAQSPRDVTRDSPGLKSPRGVKPILGAGQLDLVNFHYHLGSEHRSEGEYDLEQTWDGTGLRPGYFCNSDFGLTESSFQPYNFQFCTNVQVGNTYEVHWVHSTGGNDFKTDGLNGAFSRKNNPLVAVQSQAIKIVNEVGYEDFSLNGMDGFDSGDVALYLGSTTGPSYNNEICSAFQVNWLVDRKCKAVSASTFDNVCRTMIEVYGMSVDITPQSARELVSPELSSSEVLDHVPITPV